jgi:hypothetical protein
VPNGRRPIAAQAAQLSRSGTRDDGIGLLGLATLEYPGALQHEAARFTTDSSDDPLQSDERRRTVAAVHHEVFDPPLALDITGERLVTVARVSFGMSGPSL